MKDKYGNFIEGNFGRHVTPEALFTSAPNNPFYTMAKPYVENIFNNSSQTPGANFGAVQIKGGYNLPNSKVYPTRSMGLEYKTDPTYGPIRQRQAKEKQYNPSNPYPQYRHYNPGDSAVDSERTGLRQALDNYITTRRTDTGLPYNPYKAHSVENIRRPSSPSPLKYREHWLRNTDPNVYDPSKDYHKNKLPDKPELHALHKLSDQNKRYGPEMNTYHQIIGNWLRKEGSHINMLSERPACNKPGYLGCTQFLRHIMPRNSNYGYTSASPQEAETDRNNLYNAYDARFPPLVRPIPQRNSLVNTISPGQPNTNIFGQPSQNQRKTF